MTLQNDGFDGISLKKGEKYDFSLFARVAPGSKGGKVVVCLLDQTGREIARSSVNVSSKEWKKQQTVLTATPMCVPPCSRFSRRRWGHCISI